MHININGVSFDADVLSTEPVLVEKVAPGHLLLIDEGYGVGALAVLDKTCYDDGIVFTGEHIDAFFDYGVTVRVVVGLTLNYYEK